MKENSIIPILDELISEPQNRLIDEAIEQGKIPIGYTCSYIPEVLLSVDKLFPIRLHAPGIAGTEMADTYLSSVICSYSRSLLEFAMEGRYNFLGGWVFAASCDHIRRLHDNLDYLEKPAFNHIVDVPHKVSEDSVDWFIEELVTLRDALSSHFNVDMGDESIREAIRKHNDYVRLMKEIGELRKEDEPLLSGTEFHKLIAASLVTPKELFIDIIKKFKDEIKNRNKKHKFRARLMVVGTQLDDPGYTNVIETMGGLVVADRYCTGSLPGLDPVPEDDDVLKALVDHSFRRTSCPRMQSEFKNRLKYILEIVKEYKVDGVVIEIIKFCDIWGVDSSPLVTSLREAGIPVLKLEKEYRLSGEGQLRTRIQAFLESMGK